MQGKMERTDDEYDYYKNRNSKGLICFEKGYHEVEPLEETKYIPEFDDEWNWFRCTICNDITFTRKK